MKKNDGNELQFTNRQGILQHFQSWDNPLMTSIHCIIDFTRHC